MSKLCICVLINCHATIKLCHRSLISRWKKWQNSWKCQSQFPFNYWVQPKLTHPITTSDELVKFIVVFGCCCWSDFDNVDAVSPALVFANVWILRGGIGNPNGDSSFAATYDGGLVPWQKLRNSINFLEYFVTTTESESSSHQIISNWEKKKNISALLVSSSACYRFQMRKTRNAN